MRKKIDVKINGVCSGYKNESARKEMLTLLNLKSSTIDPNNVMGPRQSRELDQMIPFKVGDFTP